MAFERLLLDPGHGIPELDGLVLAGAGDRLAVGAEGRARHRGGVAAQHTALPARRRVPQDEARIFAAGDDCGAIGAKGDTIDEINMTGEYLKQLASRHLPDEYLGVFARAGQQLAVWAE